MVSSRSACSKLCPHITFRAFCLFIDTPQTGLRRCAQPATPCSARIVSRSSTCLRASFRMWYADGGTTSGLIRSLCKDSVCTPSSSRPQMAGLLAARMTMGHYILLLRPEHIRTVNWGGKPEKTVEEDDEGLKYYGPRRSFALYSRTVCHVVTYCSLRLRYRHSC